MIHLGNILEEIEFDKSILIQQYGTSYFLILESNDEVFYLNLITEPTNE